MGREPELSHADIQAYYNLPAVHAMAQTFAIAFVEGIYTAEHAEIAIRCGMEIAQHLRDERRESEVRWAEFRARRDL